MAETVPSPIPDEHSVSLKPTAWQTLVDMEFLIIELQLVLSAVCIIYVGAHASLRRPPSAAPPKEQRKKNGKRHNDEDETFAQGFQASDAILFPLVAACVLISLYYLIKWLQDPAILNTILRWYMSLTGVFGAGLFLGDALQVVLTLCFPDYWADGRGRIFRIEPQSRSQKLLKSSQQEESASGVRGEIDDKKRTPFPGYFSELPVPPHVTKALWTARHFLMEDWNLSVCIHGVGKDSAPFSVSTILGIVFAAVMQGLYLYSNSNILANIIGLAVCYAAFLYMSVTSFFIGSLVLVGLFFYDIVMVFYTPFMVAVATQLDAPIKLTFETASRSSILGLGDIVIPGIFICLALRFDLWRHYQGKTKREETRLETIMQDTDEAPVSDGSTSHNVTTVDVAYRNVKAPFVDPRGQWGNYFWTTSVRDAICGKAPIDAISEGAFAKTYFHATLFGYLLGMVVTVGILLVFRRGQPALLYLVPGVVGGAYITGWARGELGDMWTYTEDGSLDVEDVVVDVDGDGTVIKKNKAEASDDDFDKDDASNKDPASKQNGHDKGGDYELFTFSITVPKEQSVKED